jgi:hypothetical protein
MYVLHLAHELKIQAQQVQIDFCTNILEVINKGKFVHPCFHESFLIKLTQHRRNARQNGDARICLRGFAHISNFSLIRNIHFVLIQQINKKCKKSTRFSLNGLFPEVQHMALFLFCIVSSMRIPYMHLHFILLTISHYEFTFLFNYS